MEAGITMCLQAESNEFRCICSGYSLACGSSAAGSGTIAYVASASSTLLGSECPVERCVLP